MIKPVSIFGILVLILFISCKNLFDKTDPRPLYLNNSSNRNVIFYNASEQLSDISDPRLGSHLYSFEIDPVKKNSTEEHRLFGLAWESYLESYPNSRMIVFVLDLDSVKKYAGPNTSYPPDSSHILKKQFVNMDTLIKNNWTLVYP